MKLIKMSSLKDMVAAGAVKQAIAVKSGGVYKLTFAMNDNQSAFVYASVRQGVKQFKTLQALEGVLLEAGIKSFSVVAG